MFHKHFLPIQRDYNFICVKFISLFLAILFLYAASGGALSNPRDKFQFPRILLRRSFHGDLRHDARRHDGNNAAQCDVKMALYCRTICSKATRNMTSDTSPFLRRDNRECIVTPVKVEKIRYRRQQ